MATLGRHFNKQIHYSHAGRGFGASSGGEHDAHARAALGRGLDADASPVRLDDGACDREPQSSPIRLAAARGIDAIERLEHGRALERRDAETIVVDEISEPPLRHRGAAREAITASTMPATRPASTRTTARPSPRRPRTSRCASASRAARRAAIPSRSRSGNLFADTARARGMSAKLKTLFGAPWCKGSPMLGRNKSWRMRFL
jgi:hypothetical protein